MNNIGAALAGGNGQRRENDFYPTPWEATVALLKEVKFPKRIWEPACGDGAIVRVLEAWGHDVVATDIDPKPPMYGEWDFLRERAKEPQQAIVTNPPFKEAGAFITTAFSYQIPFAFLLKAQYWHAANRLRLFAEHPPSRVLPLTFRMDVTGQGNPTMDIMWCVWGIPGEPYKPLPKPKLTEYPTLM